MIARRDAEVDDALIAGALERFRGRIAQIPPMYSALKRDGRPLYALAREGREVERAPREVEIRRLEVLDRQGPLLELRVACSKGTYVRTLAEDIGEVLGTGAHLAALRRTAAGPFRIEQAATLEALEAMDPEARAHRLEPLDRLLEGLARVDLEPAQALRLRRGQALPMAGRAEGLYAVYGAGDLIGVARIGASDGTLRPVRLVADAPDAAQPAEKHRKTL